LTSPQPDLTTAALLAAYQQQTQSLRAQLETFIRQLWRFLGVYREPQMRDFAGQVVPMVAGAQRQMSSLTAAYLATERQLQTGRAGLATVDPNLVTGRAVRAADPTEVYGRPFHLVWRELHDTPKQPGAIEAAIQHGEDRAVNLAQTDLQLSKTATSQRLLQADPAVTGYRRVLEGPRSCGLCIVAATLLYHKAKLLPIHPGCDCSVEPVRGAQQRTGETLVRQGADLIPVGELQDVHDAIRERFGADNAGARVIPGQGGLKYRDVLIEHRNSEIGPVLAVRGQSYTAL
jgi:hypothetical protein